MAIRHKRKSTSGYLWQTGDLVDGQIGLNTADGTAHIKKVDGTIVSLQGGTGGGDVTSSSTSSTDNALTRFDGTTGKKIQTSTVTLSDTNILSGINGIETPDYVQFDTTVTPVEGIAKLQWDDGNGTLQVGLKGGNVNLQIGQETLARVYNDSGVALTDGQVVYISGAQGNRIAVKLAKADSETTSAGTLGIVTEPIAIGGEGFITITGTINKLNTSGLTAGSLLYLSATTAGAYTPTAPTAPNHRVTLGYVERVGSVVGSIYVKVDNGYELGELHDVVTTNPADKDFLRYNNTTKVWENKAVTTTDLTEGTNLYFTTARARSSLSAGTGISYNNTTGVITSSITQYTDASARSSISMTDAGGDGSASYNSTTGVITYTGPSATDYRAAFSAGTGITYNSSTGVIGSSITQYTDTNARAALSGGTGISYNSTTGVISSSITQYTDANARSAISLTDAGGDGSASYNSSTGVITYTGPSATEYRAALSAGSGITYNSSTGIISAAAAAGGGLIGVTAYSTAGSGTFTKNAATTKLFIRAVGGGGGGGSNVGGGGGGGGYSHIFISSPAASYAYTVGAGGGAGGAGGTTTVAGMSCSGGSPGSNGSGLSTSGALGPIGGGAGGVASGGNVDITGARGCINVMSLSGATRVGPGAAGGTSAKGSVGSGGQGGGTTPGTNYGGQSGYAGYVEIWEFA